MSDPHAHLKLDRILAELGGLSNRMTALDEALRIVVGAIALQREAINTNTEMVDRLARAISEEAGSGDLAKELAAIADILKLIRHDGVRMALQLRRILATVAKDQPVP